MLNLQAIFVDSSYPDENFAREIMQLFTIGLWELNDDGTLQMDASGDLIMTYTNDDILTLSRAWTGHDTAHKLLSTQQSVRWDGVNRGCTLVQ